MSEKTRISNGFLRSRYGCTHCRDSEFDKCKSEDAGPWRSPGLGREWARRLAPFSMEMLIFHWFLKEKATTAGSSRFALFISFSGDPGAKVHADKPEYRESADMPAHII